MEQTIISALAVWGLMLTVFFAWLLWDNWRKLPKLKRVEHFFVSKSAREIKPFRVGKDERVSGGNSTARTSRSQKKR